MNTEQTQALEIIPEGAANLGLANPAAPMAAITPAQAKVDAIASLTMSAYQKAATLELTPEESAKLQADFPDEAFQPGAAGKENLIYIEHAHLRDRFNEVFGMGKWAIVPRNRWAEDFTFTNKYREVVQASRVYVEAMLVVRGCFVGEAVGDMVYYKNNESQNYGDAVEGAKTAAFRRCAKEFGIGLQAWKKEWCEGWWQRKRSGSRQKPPVAVPTPTQPKTAPKPAQEPGNVVLAPTDAHRKRLIELLTPLGAPAVEYCQKAGMLLPTEELGDLPLRFVPATKEQKEAFMACVQEFVNGGEAKKPGYVAETDDVPMEFPPDDLANSLAKLKRTAESVPANRIIGLVQTVSEKPGTGKNGKPYTKVGVKIADGWLNSFDTKIAEVCRQAKENGDKVDIEYKETKFGREIVSCLISEEVTP